MHHNNMTTHMLTTADNPYNPFTMFDEWLQFDESSGYYTNAYLARVVVSSDELSVGDQHQAYEEGMDEIIREDVFGIYLKVDRETADVRSRT